MYACRLENADGDVMTILKAKGITLDSEAAKLVTLDKMEEMAREYVENDNVIEVCGLMLGTNIVIIWIF